MIKRKAFSTNIFIKKDGSLFIEKEKIDNKNSKYITIKNGEYYLNIQGIFLNIKDLFGCGFVNPRGYNFIYKNEKFNNAPENIDFKNVKLNRTWKYVGDSK